MTAYLILLIVVGTALAFLTVFFVALCRERTRTRAGVIVRVVDGTFSGLVRNTGTDELEPSGRVMASSYATQIVMFTKAV